MAEDITSESAVRLRSMEESRTFEQPTPMSPTAHEQSDDFDDTDTMAVSNITNEDAQALIEPTISHLASRMKSPQTPALEKAAAMEEAGAFFDSEMESPPAESESPLNGNSAPDLPTNIKISSGRAETTVLRGNEADAGGSPAEGHSTPCSPKYNRTSTELMENVQLPKENGGLSLGELPPPNLDAPTLPTPWHPGPKPFVFQPKGTSQQSSLTGVFNGPRTRSLSGGAEALRKLLPKGLPSMAQVGSLFGSSSGNRRSFAGSSSPPKDAGSLSTARSSSPTVLRFPSNGPFPQVRVFDKTLAKRAPVGASPPGGLPSQKNLRRVTSDESLLYHSLSRASSLGDDSRFENHREQVNSRVKAIRDSLQDRSSFKMPQMPSMPSMPRVPSFGFNFNMNFLTATDFPAANWRRDTDMKSEILPAAITKKTLDSVAKPAVAPGMVGAAVSRPEAAIRTAQPLTEGSASTAFDRVLESLTGDVVIMGGYRGSILRSTKTNRRIWVPVKVGLNIRKVDLEVGLDPEDEERMPETIYPSGMLQKIGPVDISKRLFKRLSECENAKNGTLRVWNYGYDWRLSPHLLSRQLTEYLEKLPSNQPTAKGSSESPRGALVIAHSLGGLITRWVVNHRPELFSGVVYAGVPKSCVNILGPLRNGDAVLLSSRVLTAQVNFTLRTSFVLLPEDGECFFDIKTREKYPVDFFNIDDWIKYRLSPCTDPPLPPWNHQSGALGGLLNMSSSFLSLPIPGKKSISGTSSPQGITYEEKNENTSQSHSPTTMTTQAANVIRGADGGTDRTLAPQMGITNPVSKGQNTNSSVSTAVTIPRDKAIAYLRRTLAETKKFKQELHFKPSLSEANRYPPLAVIYGKSIPTCCGAKVDGRDSIPCSDVYDNLAFASGDGVCLAKEAMLPEGYKVAFGGRISSDRGHVTLLGDLSAVGRALEAVIKGRQKGIGMGVLHSGAIA